MHKSILSLIATLIIFSSVLISCKTNKNIGSEKAEVIFGLNATPCPAQCPVFELTLYGDKILIFEGKKYTALEGVHKKKLSDREFEALLGIIESSDWSEFEPSYTSTLSGLSTYNYNYNRNGISRTVSQYGMEPSELTEMSEVLLTYVQERVFEE